ncbi:permease [Gorillibacterium sp. CAU 1737]|uniref:permease n=1 Tax=Gorillibacterium sp. CAU 1737 TaxID=3140362 RepID=UPI00326179E8
MTRRTVSVAAISLALLAVLLLSGLAGKLDLTAGLSFLGTEEVQAFKAMFISLFLEAFPYLLLGAFVSSILQVLVKDEWIQRVIPRGPIGGMAAGSLLGLLLPICECGMVPVVRRLLRKGMPLHAGVAFLLAGPIVNPVVWSATWAAFRLYPAMVYARMGLALLVAFTISGLVYRFVRSNPLREAADDHEPLLAQGSSHAWRAGREQRARGGKLASILDHTANELVDTGKYLVLGIAVTAWIQATIPRAWLMDAGQEGWATYGMMLGLAYVSSLCSTSDAFVAASFAGVFPAGALLTFLVAGPMLDFKTTLLLLSGFRARFVLLLAGAVAVTVTGGAMLWAHWVFP